MWEPALKHLPNEICFCFSRMEKLKLCLETLDREGMTENNIHLVKIDRNIIT